MKAWLRKKFAFTETGANDMVKAIFSCACTNIGLMFPVGVTFFFLEKMLSPYFGAEAEEAGFLCFLGICILVLFIIFILEYIQYNKTYLASYSESANLRLSLAERLRKLPMAFFGQRDLADLTTTIMSDTAFLEQAFSHFICELFGAAISTVLIGIVIACINWKMAAALLWVVPVSLILAFGTRPLVDKRERRQKDKKLAASDGIQECIENIQDIKANNQQETYLKGLDEKLLNVEKSTLITEWTNGTFVTAATMCLKIGMATTVLAGVKLLAAGEIDFFLLLMFLIAATRLYEPLAGTLQNLSAVFSTVLVAERMEKINEESVQGGASELKNKGCDIAFDHVAFSYNTGETVLKDVSFTAKQGEVTALVGPSGGGKSTAAKLAARFWDVTEGKITLGGADIRKTEPEKLLQQFSIVFQDVVLFNNTIMENIRIGRRDATDAEVMAAAKAARCEEFIEKLPDGYQTVIGENGAALSGGERQRLSIARALLKNAPVILLDEATASLDVENETKIQEAISTLVRGKTVLLIAHRMRTVAGADKIVVLKDGQVAEQGSPDELMKKNGIYSHMMKLQTESQSWVLER